MRTVIAWNRIEEVAGPGGVDGLTCLLSFIASGGQIAIEQSRRQFVSKDCLERWAAHEHFAPSVMGRPDNRFGRKFRLKDRGHWLRMPGQAGLAPTELRRVERRHLNHRDMDVAAIMDQLGSQRISEAPNGVLGPAIWRLQRNGP